MEPEKNLAGLEVLKEFKSGRWGVRKGQKRSYNRKSPTAKRSKRNEVDSSESTQCDGNVPKGESAKNGVDTDSEKDAEFELNEDYGE